MLALPQNEFGVCAHEAYGVSENRVSHPSSLPEGRRRPTDMPLVRAMETQIAVIRYDSRRTCPRTYCADSETSSFGSSPSSYSIATRPGNESCATDRMKKKSQNPHSTFAGKCVSNRN